jgi:hypothetical protein
VALRGDRSRILRNAICSLPVSNPLRVVAASLRVPAVRVHAGGRSHGGYCDTECQRLEYRSWPRHLFHVKTRKDYCDTASRPVPPCMSFSAAAVEKRCRSRASRVRSVSSGAAEGYLLMARWHSARRLSPQPSRNAADAGGQSTTGRFGWPQRDVSQRLGGTVHVIFLPSDL